MTTQFMVQTGTLMELEFHGPFATEQEAREYAEWCLDDFPEVGVIPLTAPRNYKDEEFYKECMKSRQESLDRFNRNEERLEGLNK
jgi:hypothetical protein